MPVGAGDFDLLLTACGGATGRLNLLTNEAQFSQSWMDLLGLPMADPAASRLSEWDARCHPSDWPSVQAARSRIQRGEADRYRMRTRMRHADGRWRDLEVCAIVPPPAGGGPPGWLAAIAFDLTSRIEDGERWRALAETSADWFWMSDVEHRITRCEVADGSSPPMAATRLIGRRLDELQRAGPAPSSGDAWQVLLSRRSPFKGQGCRLSADEGVPELWVEMGGRPLLGADGRFCGYEGVGRDISDVRLATQTLRQGQLMADSLFESIPVPVALKDLQGRYQSVNQAMCELFGLDKEAVVGHLPADIFDAQAAVLHAAADARLLQGSASRLQYEAHQVTSSGRTVDTLVSKLAMKDAEGRIVGLVTTVADVGSMKAVERELAEAKDAAEAASRAKSTFLSTISHEIRTPMTAIIGMSNLALQGALDPQQRHFVQTVHRSAQGLLSLIDDILDFSKIEAGRFDVEQTDFDLAVVMDDLAGLLAMRARDKGLELVFDQSPRVPEQLIGDPVRLRQVLVNLGGNALKFTSHGEVVIAIDRVGGDERSVRLSFEVRDTGPGMSPDVCGRLFRPFVQADASTSRRYGGTGLGLAISQRLVELMGGHILVDTAPGQGSRFCFELSFGLGPQRPLDDRAHALGNLQLLVVDDNPSARQTLVAMARALGLGAESAPDEPQALQLLSQRHAQEQTFGLVIIDWKMPQADGIECLQSMARTPMGHRLPVVLMATAFEQEDLRLRLADLGLEGSTVLCKPVNPSSLLDACHQAMGLPVRPAARRPAEPSLEAHQASLRGARVLLVEDNAINQELARELLIRSGIEVKVVEDGVEAIEALSKESFDGVLMDCQMPRMDGYQATRALRRDPRRMGLPIIAMTANAMIGDRERALAAGMNDHIGKPIRVEEMFATLARWVRPQAPGPAPAVATESNVALEDIPGIDASLLGARVMGNAEFQHRLLSLFVAELVDFPLPFEQALVAHDLALLHRLAHSLKSMAGTLGAMEIERKSAVLEADCSADADPAVLRSDLDGLSLSLIPLLAAVRGRLKPSAVD